MDGVADIKLPDWGALRRARRRCCQRAFSVQWLSPLQLGKACSRTRAKQRCPGPFLLGARILSFRWGLLPRFALAPGRIHQAKHATSVAKPCTGVAQSPWTRWGRGTTQSRATWGVYNVPPFPHCSCLPGLFRTGSRCVLTPRVSFVLPGSTLPSSNPRPPVGRAYASEVARIQQLLAPTVCGKPCGQAGGRGPSPHSKPNGRGLGLGGLSGLR